MGHVKNWAQATVLKTSFPDSDTARPFLDAYFPKQLRDRFASSLGKHPLRLEIIATAAVNYVVNKAGIRFIFQMLSASRKDLGVVMRAYLELDRECAAPDLRARVLTANLAPQKEYDALLRIEAALAMAARERLDGKSPDVKRTLAAAAVPAPA
jgi:glutamate dehydrogenase